LDIFDGTIDKAKYATNARTPEQILEDYKGTTPFWVQWWFWTIIVLSVVAILSLFTTLHYRKKAPKSKET